MTTTRPGVTTAQTIDSAGPAYVSAAAQRLYAQEIALHDVHQSGDDGWIAAAADRLQEALVAYPVVEAGAGAEPCTGRGTRRANGAGS
jgi:hypothetical protein